MEILAEVVPPIGGHNGAPGRLRRNGQVGMSALASSETQFHVGSATGTSIGAIAGGLDPPTIES